MSKLFLTFALATVALMAWTTSSTDANPQERDSNRTVSTTVQDPFPQNSNRVKSRLGFRTESAQSPRSNFDRRNENPFAKAIHDLKAAEDDDAKDKAMASIQDQLEKQYDAFLVDNEKQIEELQTRLDNLKEQLDRRRRAKNKMVELEMERVINESEGLVWPSRGRRQGNLFYSAPGGTTPWRNSNVPAVPGPATYSPFDSPSQPSAPRLVRPGTR